MLTLTDVVVLAIVVLAGLGGWARGLVRTVGGVGGFVLGAVGGSWLAGRVVNTDGSLLTRLLLDAGCILGGALIGTGVGVRLGALAGAALRRVHLRLPDQAGGAVVGAVSALLACWMIAGVLLGSGSLGAADSIRGSVLLTKVSAALPSRPDVSRTIMQALRAPADLTALVPAYTAGSLGTGTVREVANRAASSVVQITGAGCGTSLSEGSGFVVASLDGVAGLVVTNAHVIAGADEISVSGSSGPHRAVPVVYDPAADIAVLRVDGLDVPALTLRPSAVPNGTRGVVLGYPGGGPLTASAATVEQQVPLVDRQVGGSALVARSAYRIDAKVRPGNSGGPLLGTGGQVIGVVNARSLVDGHTGFALTLGDTRADIAKARAATSAVDTGVCAAA